MSPLTALTSVWRQWRPRVDARAGSRALINALQTGMSLGDALAFSAPMLAKVAVREAAARFEGGALALLIVDVRDSLRRQLLEAGTEVQDASLLTAFGSASFHVDGETFVGHLINTLLTSTGLYVESQALDSFDEARATRVVAALFSRSLCVLISRTDAARRIGERTRRSEFIPFPQPSAPR
jgi:hypothetical protein